MADTAMKSLGGVLARQGILVAFILFMVGFTLWNPRFIDIDNVFGVVRSSAILGIMALGVTFVVIGGNLDLSVGSMVAFAGLIFGAAVTVLQLPLILAILVTFVMAAAFGTLNGQIVLRTGLPSFIVTLAFLFILRGLTLVGLKWATGGSTQMRGIREAVEGSLLTPLFSGQAFTGLFAWLAERGMIETFANGTPKVTGISVDILWFLGLAAVGTVVLTRTRIGNWIFAAGGDGNSARNSGVPVNRVKTALFITTACCATLVAILTVMDTGSTDARRGFQKEFEAIIAAVIGGCLLTGGYGSVIGAFFGAIIFGMVLIGLTYTQIDQDWYLVFLGGMLLMAVFFNNIVRKRATGER